MQDRKRKPTRPTPPVPEKILLSDREGAFLAGVGMTKWAELQRDPTFPKALWLGPRSKRHEKDAVLAWLASLRTRRIAA